MKTRFYTKTLIALAVAVAAAAAAVSQAQEQPIPPPSTESALPANIVPGTPLAEVVKMVQAGVDANTIQSYVANSQNAFNLDADKIIYLKDMGVPSDLVNAMMDRDKVLYASNVAPPPAPAPATSVVTSAPDTAPPAEVTVNYFYNTLSPYGAWVDVDGYGRCWRPTAVIYDSNWRPYCDRGHWVYTDCGWYWDSDYSWGVAFHYGRWFHHARFGWCWYPDTVWAPSWVAWRSGGDYCGWAPLPPFSEFRPGFGFYYHGAGVAMDFDFGLNVDCFTFVSAGHFCDRHPRSYCVERARLPEVFHRTTIINNYSVNNRIIENRGIAVDHIRNVTHRDITPVHVGSLPRSARQGWHGDDGPGHTFHQGEADHGNRELGNHGNLAPRGGTIGNNFGHDNDNAGHALNAHPESSGVVRVNHGTSPGNVIVTGGESGRHDNGGSTTHGFNSTTGNHIDSTHSTFNGGDAARHENSFPATRSLTSTGNHVESAPLSPAQNLSSGTVNRSGETYTRPQRHIETTGNAQIQSLPPSSTAVTHQQPQSFVREQSQAQPVTHSANSFSAGQNTFNAERNNSAGSFPQHGAAQLEQHQVVQHQVVQQSQPHVETHPAYVESTPRNNIAPSSNSGGSQSQSRPANSDSSGGGNNNNRSDHSSENHRNH
jgi:hypothetical protein